MRTTSILSLTLTLTLTSTLPACGDPRDEAIEQACQIYAEGPSTAVTATPAAPAEVTLDVRFEITLSSEGGDYFGQAAFEPSFESEFVFIADLGTNLWPESSWGGVVDTLDAPCDGTAVGVAAKYIAGFGTVMVDLSTAEAMTQLVIVDNEREHDWSLDDDDDDDDDDDWDDWD